ncbi:MAG: cobaltochelatase subunit CobN, partial [Clostridiales bacterium]|nr:cobaltochelatase subunit CobN [Clostridiales bacterium]
QNGISPVDYLANIVLPETDGGIEPLLLCATEEIAGSEFEAVVPINDRIVRCAGRIRRMMKLKKTDNSRKKLALVVYNYPPGDHNLANAAYLDSFESIRNILIRLDKEGYNVGEIPENISELFLENNIVNSPKWSSRHCGALIDKDEYENLLSSCPELKKDIEGIWGTYPGAVNTYDGKIRIPYLRFGNIYVTLQPSRGCHEDPQKFYHDKSIPPHHQYAAFYRWLEKNMDAVIHIGTHGTLEFMRGKEMTISKNCDMDILIGDLPHFYIYQVGNPSEAMTAKRRSLATLIGYSTPSADGAGLYGEYLALRELFDELHEARLMNSQRVPSIEEEIRQKAEENNWADLKGDLEAIEGRLTDLQRSLIPIGLHTFGNTMEEKERIDFLASVMRFDRGGIKSVNRVLAEQDGFDYTKMLEQKSPKLIEYDLKARELISAWIRGEEAPPELKDQKAFITGVLKNIESDFELDGLINALSGGYAGSGLAADVLKNPEVFPSGRNLYQFNPLSIPTASALERGRTIALNTLKQYRGKNGEYPKSVGVVLWGFETAKTCGETVGQVMEYLGVRIKSETGSWFTQIEPVPREELTHPRIDVTIQICGFFRDMFPNLVALLDDAVRIAAKLDEPDNAVYDKAVSICSLLISEGIDKKSAEEMSFIRIFGPRESEYGTSLTTMIENAAWQDERELGESYERDMSYAYGRNISGAENRRLNKILLSQVEMISQVQDTYEYDVTDLDHYYEFFGGFSKAVENNRGEKPQMLATNTASEIIRTEDISDAISRGAVSRTFNPKWINAMLEHDYHGAQKIADRIQYQIGLSATTGSVEQWVWEKTAQTFLFDDEMLRKLRENNVHAANEIAMRLYEAKQRGYWKASAEEAEKLMRILMEFEEHLEGGS